MEAEAAAEVRELPNLLVLGLFLMFGGRAYAIARYLRLPRVTLLVISGIIIGPSGFDLVPDEIVELFPIMSYIALSMIAFRLGETFINFDLLQNGPRIFIISLGKAIASATLVFTVAFLIQEDLVLALLLAGLAPASAPAATLDVINETNSRGALTDTIIRVLAVDNVLGILIFTILLVVSEVIAGAGNPSTEIIEGMWEIGGAVLLGLTIGWPMARLAGGLKKGKPSLLEITGFLLLCAGLAYQLQVSYLLACIILGATVAKNRAQPKINIFQTIEEVNEPFLVIFFLLAGCELDLSAIGSLGLIGVLYVLARCIGFIIGGRIAARLVNAQRSVQENIGWSLFPQAGVALGLAVLTMEDFPGLGQFLVSITVSTTVVFELFGPTVTQWRLFKAKEAANAVETTSSDDLPFIQKSK